nr:MazG nucleotide pyrophosphohydrolase domain-containing protein [Paenibacillus sp. MZ04-78.2]
MQKNRGELMGELRDILANLAILADKYGFTLEDAAKAHQEKLLKRFEADPVN